MTKDLQKRVIFGRDYALFFHSNSDGWRGVPIVLV